MHKSISRRRAAKLIGATAATAFLPIGVSRFVAAAESAGKILRSIPSTGEKLPVIGAWERGLLTFLPALRKQEQSVRCWRFS